MGTGCINSPGLFNPANVSGNVGYFQSGVYIEHVATGLWVLGNYGRERLSDMPSGNFTLGVPGAPTINLDGLNDNPDHWYVKAGLRERWTSIGHTVMYGFYGQRNDMISGATVAFDNVTGSKTRQYGLGVVQEVDAAAMSLWLQWDHEKADVSCGRLRSGLLDPVTGLPTAFAFDNNVTSGLDHIDIIKGGALINF